MFNIAIKPPIFDRPIEIVSGYKVYAFAMLFNRKLINLKSYSLDPVCSYYTL